MGPLGLIICRERDSLSHRESFCREVVHSQSWLAGDKGSHAQSWHVSVFWEASVWEEVLYVELG